MSYYENLFLFEEDLARAVKEYYGKDNQEFLRRVGLALGEYQARGVGVKKPDYDITAAGTIPDPGDDRYPDYLTMEYRHELSRAVFDYYGRDVNEFLNQIGRCVMGFNEGMYAHGDTISNEIETERGEDALDTEYDGWLDEKTTEAIRENINLEVEIRHQKERNMQEQKRRHDELIRQLNELRSQVVEQQAQNSPKRK